MGKMKEFFMQQRMEEGALYAQELTWDPQDFKITSNILCPNCTIEYLEQEDEDELKCPACGHEFQLIDNNTVIFK